jgi:hypothetical protein
MTLAFFILAAITDGFVAVIDDGYAAAICNGFVAVIGDHGYRRMNEEYLPGDPRPAPRFLFIPHAGAGGY